MTIDLTGFDAAKTFDDSNTRWCWPTMAASTTATPYMAVASPLMIFSSSRYAGERSPMTDAPCYRAVGIATLTPSGEVPVEQLAIGDLIVTRSVRLALIKWVTGRRSYAALLHRRESRRAANPFRCQCTGRWHTKPRPRCVAKACDGLNDEVLVPAGDAGERHSHPSTHGRRQCGVICPR